MKKKLTTDDYPYRIKIIYVAAKRRGWAFVNHYYPGHSMSFKRQDVKLTVYYGTMTVSTSLKHPVKGRTRLFRRDVDYTILRRIFENPRVHTQLGYFSKTDTAYAKFDKKKKGGDKECPCSIIEPKIT